MRNTKININNYVVVCLTDAGRAVYAAHQAEFPVRYRGSFPVPDVDGFCMFQLWNFMEIFGPHVTQGQPMLFNADMQIRNTSEPSLSDPVLLVS